MAGNLDPLHDPAVVADGSRTDTPRAVSHGPTDLVSGTGGITGPAANQPAPGPDPLLDPEETSVMDPAQVPSATTTAADEALQRSWRHSHWQDRRARTYRAMQAAGIGENRLSRYRECGSASFVLRHKDRPDEYCLATNRCHDRFCEACQRERRRGITAKFTRDLPAGKLRFLTLTRKSNDDPLARRLRGLYADWRSLRTFLVQKNLLTGGICFLEINRNETTNHWHPHLHILCQGKYLPHKLIRDKWFEITGDSYIVDIREIKNPAIAAAYVMKYAGKGIGQSVWKHQPALIEAIQALTGKRTFNTFGTWHGIGLLKHETQSDDWEYLCTLAELIERARAGDDDSRRILHQLANGRSVEPLDVTDDISRSPPRSESWTD